MKNAEQGNWQIKLKLNEADAELDGQIEAAQEKIQAIKSENKRLTDESPSLESEVEGLKAQVATKNLTLKTLRCRLGEFFPTPPAGVTADIANLKKANETMQKQINVLQKEKESLPGQIEACEADIASKTKEIERITKEHAALKAEVETLNAEMREKKQALAALQAEHKKLENSLKTQIMGLAHTIPGNLTGEHGERKQEITNLRKEKAGLNTSNTELAANISNFTKQVEKLQKDCEKIDSDYASENATVESLKAKKNELNDALTEKVKMRDLLELHKEVLGLQARKVESEKYIAEAAAELEEINATQAELAKQKELLGAEVEDLERQETDGWNALETRKNEIAEAKEQKPNETVTKIEEEPIADSPKVQAQVEQPVEEKRVAPAQYRAEGDMPPEKAPYSSTNLLSIGLLVSSAAYSGYCAYQSGRVLDAGSAFLQLAYAFSLPNSTQSASVKIGMSSLMCVSSAFLEGDYRVLVSAAPACVALFTH